MAINFPTGATLNQIYTYNSLSWQWTGSYWKIYPSKLDFLPLSGGVLSGGLIAPTISATTYYNLPLDITVTGGTYSGGTAVFTNNTGGTFNVTGFYTGLRPTTTVTISTVLTDIDQIIIVDSTSAVTITLPQISVDGRFITIKNINTGTETILPYSGQLIDNDTSIVVARKNVSLDLQSYNNNWYVI